MICHFLLRRQRLCFAVARIFVRGLTYPKAVRESTRRMLRYSLLLVVLPCGRRMALVSDVLSEGPPFSLRWEHALLFIIYKIGHRRDRFYCGWQYF